MGRKTKTLAEQLAELDNPAPKDFDPEEEVPQSDSDQDSGADDDNEKAARDHYVDVGKSKLRKRDIVPLGPRYEGSKVSRGAVTEDDDEDDPFSKGFDEEESDDDVEDVHDESVSGEDDDEEGVDGESEDDDDDDDDDELQDGEESPATDLSDEDDDDDDEDEGEAAQDRAELRKMMAEEQKSVAASLSQAAKQDAEKGRAVKTQRTTFDSLLNARIKLQKALVGANTVTALQDEDDASVDTAEDAFRAAETAAFTLWSSLNDLRESLESSRTGEKRKRPEFTLDTPAEDLWAHMQAQEASSHTYRNTVLEKWSAKAKGATAITPRNRLNNTAQQTIVDVLQEQLNAPERLIKRARTPRSCAPLQVNRKVTEADDVYDDADFYGLLLQSLLEQRSADSVAASASNIDVSFQMRRDAKTKKNIDTKASKGRKLRYTVHEKLQNFMAPEDRSTWGERQSDELFGSLFGQRLALVDEDDEAPQQDDGDVVMDEAGLMMFRS